MVRARTTTFLFLILCLRGWPSAVAQSPTKAIGPAEVSASQAVSPMRVGDVYTEHLVDPEGIDEPHPRFTWELSDDRRGARQSAYRIVVRLRPSGLMGQGPAVPNWDEAAPDVVWDSGQVASDATALVMYTGRDLEAGKPYWWSVRVWDEAGRGSAWSAPGRFSMGLFERGQWGAKWIGEDADPPVVEPGRNGYHSEMVDVQDTAKWATLDLGAAKRFDALRLHPARPFNWRGDRPGFLFPLRFKLEVSDAADFPPTATRMVLDRTGADEPNPGAEARAYALREPVSARYARLTVTRLTPREGGQFGFALAEMELAEGASVVSGGAAVTSSDSTETNGWSRAFLSDGRLESYAMRGSHALPGVRVRKEFSLPAGRRVARAVLYATARGVYEAHLNGAGVGDRVLAPEWTDYRKRIQYQAYDVTGLIRDGANALAFDLGDGWYAGRLGMLASLTGGPGRGFYGRTPSVMARLAIELDSGETQTVVTDSSWSCTSAGPNRSADLLDGQVVDGRMETPGWTRAGFGGAGWSRARVCDDPGAALVAQPNEPLRVVEELTPTALTEPAPGVYVFDMGQNMVGFCELRVRAPAGTEIRLRHAEAVLPDGPIYTDNLRGAPQVDRYIASGGADERFAPRFTYHGFRYVEVTGLPSRPERTDLTGRVVTSSVRGAGSFECSEAMLNRLWKNIQWTHRANLFSVPTDCPQRDERLGWTGDILVFARTACFNAGMAAFIGKWTADLRDGQTEDGRFSDVAPHFAPPDRPHAFTGVPAWGDVGVFLPWDAWEWYGDARTLERNLAAMERWVAFITRHNPDGLWRKERGNDYNDWLNGDTLRYTGYPTKGGSIPNDVFATAFYARSAWIVGRAAQVLKRADVAERHEALFTKVREAFNRAFVKDDGTILGDTQAGYALALNFDLLPEAARARAVTKLLAGLDRYDGQMSTGFHSTHRMMIELTESGHADRAYALATSTRFPAWGYAVKNGATTIWERWDGYVRERATPENPKAAFQDPGMNSLNHWAFGAVGEWMFRTMLGINPDPESPGWGRIRLRPIPGGEIGWVRGEHRTIRGMVRSAWKVEGGVLTYECTVPPNVVAALELPAEDPAGVTESGRVLREAPGVEVLDGAGGAGSLRCRLSSGSFSFRVPLSGGATKPRTAAPLTVESFRPLSLRGEGGRELPYRLFDPRTEGRASPADGFPLVVFLHGMGERGTDNLLQLTHKEFLTLATPEARERHPAFVVAPQCPPDLVWSDVLADPSRELGARPSPALALVKELIERLTGELPIDSRRVYLTGLSMGGYGTWEALARWPELFAAGVPICGGGDPASARRLASMPVWAFHSSDDRVVPVGLTRRMVNAMTAAGGAPTYTEYADKGHASWIAAYAEPGLVEWLFAQRRPPRGRSPRADAAAGSVSLVRRRRRADT
ncbi:MAG: family 78 glycoside hydrolase catalytic domain [Phycisphaerae bacterium]|nr:family 78 glycoside hydrolase catalytic domain [Phycisphaerae bacterium]